MDEYTIVLVWSKCENTPDAERSQFNYVATEKEKQYLALLQNRVQNLSLVRSFDVCNSTNELLNILVNVSLDSEYFFPVSTNTFAGGSWSASTMNLIILLGYVTEPQSKLIMETMIFMEAPRICMPLPCDDRVAIKTPVTYSVTLMNLMDRFEWTHLKMLSVVDREVFPYHAYFKESVNMMKETERFCIHTKVLNMTHFPGAVDVNWNMYQQHIAPFLGDDENSVFILFGNIHKISQILSYFGSRAGMLIIHDEEAFSGVFPNPRVLTVTESVRYKSVIHGNEDDIDTYFDIGCQFFFWMEESFRSDKISDIQWLEKNRHRFLLDMDYQLILPIKTEVRLPHGFRLPIDQAKSMTEAFLTKENHGFPVIKCPRLNCTPGYERRYSQLAIHTNIISNYYKQEYETEKKHETDERRYGMKCVLCPVDHVKPEYGDSPYIPCTGLLSIDNGMRTLCIDPYTDKDLKMSNLILFITYTSGITGVCMVALVFVLFVLNRDSPTVRSSDFYLSSVHLAAIGMTYVIGIAGVMLLEYSGITTEKCVLPNVNISVFFCINVACVYTKSEKLLSAFLSNVRITAEEMHKTIVTQVLTFIILLLTTNCLLCVLYFNHAPRVEFWLDTFKIERIHFCNTTHHQTYLILFFAFFQLVCSVQAFRGRHLPGHMNDAMSMVYSILISTATFAVSFPIRYFGGHADVQSVQLLVVFINSFCFLVFLYGPKCYVIVFKPQRNTRQYFNQQRMAAMAEKTGLENGF